MKILHVLDHSAPLHSGYAFRTLALLREQRLLGYEVCGLTSTRQGPVACDVEECEGFRFFRTATPQTGWRTLPVLNQIAFVKDTARRLRQVIALARPDLLHAHSPCLTGIAALRAARHAGIPLVYEMRASWEDAAVDHGHTSQGSLRYRLSRAAETWVLNRANAVTTICEGLRIDILSRGIAASRVTVIPNGVDVEMFPLLHEIDAGLKRSLGLETAYVIGFAGSFYRYEGLDLLIRALPAIRRHCPQAKLLLLGGGPEERNLATLATELGVRDLVVLPGRVPHADVARYYSIIDLLAFPRRSTRLTETVTPLKPLESMAQGRLLIASNVGGHCELIDDGRTGFLFPPDDPDSIAQAVQRVLECRAAWPAIRAAGRHYVELERTWRSSAARYPAVYDYAMATARGP